MRAWILAAGLVACCTASVWCAVPETDRTSDRSRPNILFIFTDDQSHRSVGCYDEAHPWVKTPNIDHLAKEGVRFESAYIGTWCMPSRAQMLTGRLPHGIQSMRMQGEYPGSVYQPQQCPFWPSAFRKAGYSTGMIGKWHTGFDTGAGRDWDHQAVWSHVDPRQFGGYYVNQSISFNGSPPEKVDGYSTDNYTKWGVEFIQGKHRPKHKPWFLWLCYDAVHSPYTEAKRHAKDYPDADWPHPVLIEQTRWFYGSDTDEIPAAEQACWDSVPWYLLLRHGQYKYIRTLVPDEIEELYDLETDPKELVNLALDPGHRETLQEYRRRLLDELRRTKVGMMENLPRLAPD